MSGAPQVTAIIPVRDRAALVARAIDSVLRQTHPSFELVVVDDGSRDATPAVLSSYGSRLRRVRLPPSGRSAARNAGIAQARGAWLAFLDSDDAWVPEKLARQAAFHAANPDVAMSAHGLEIVTPDGHAEPAPPRTRAERLGESFLGLADHFAFVLSAVMVRADAARTVGGFDPEFDGTEDLDFALRVARGFRVGVFADCLTRYHLHDGQTGRRRIAGGNARVLRRHLEAEADEPLRARMRGKLARYLVSSAKRAESAAERRRLLEQAADLDPQVRFRAAWLRQRFGLGPALRG